MCFYVKSRHSKIVHEIKFDEYFFGIGGCRLLGDVLLEHEYGSFMMLHMI